MVGYPFSGGQPRPGVDEGPEALVEAGLLDQIAALGWVVEFNKAAIAEVRELAMADSETDADVGKLHRPRAVSAVNQRVAQDVSDIIERGAMPLTLGGDHSLVSGDNGAGGSRAAITAVGRSTDGDAGHGNSLGSQVAVPRRSGHLGKLRAW